MLKFLFEKAALEVEYSCHSDVMKHILKWVSSSQQPAFLNSHSRAAPERWEEQETLRTPLEGNAEHLDGKNTGKSIEILLVEEPH